MIATPWIDSLLAPLDPLRQWAGHSAGCLYFCSVAALAMVSVMIL
jgi:hypothetical protein